jgi:hypothetical protein
MRSRQRACRAQALVCPHVIRSHVDSSRHGQPAAFTGATFKKRLEQHVVKRLAPGELFATLAKKFETERRTRLKVGKKCRRAIAPDIGHSHQDQRPPTHAQQALQRRAAMRHAVHAVGNLMAEIQQLPNQTVQRFAFCNRPRKQCDRAALQILADILQVVSQLQKHPHWKAS